MRSRFSLTVNHSRPGLEELEDRCVPATVFALNSAGTALLRFDSATPNSVATVGTVSGLQTGEVVEDIDFRVRTGDLLGVARLGTTARVVTINTTTAAATPIGTNTVTLTGRVGVDVNPTVDRFRIVSSDNQNFRFNPNDGTFATDGTLVFAAGDASAGPTADPNVVAEAYTNNFDGATTTSLYAVDSMLDRLLLQGGPNGQPSPNTGRLFTVGGLGENVDDLTGLDITSTNQAFVSFTAAGATNSRLLAIPDLTFGALAPSPSTATVATANVIGDATTGTIRSIAVAPAGQFRFGAASFMAGEGAGGVTITVTRASGSDGMATVQYAATAGSAMAGSDFTPVAGTLTFMNGETMKTFVVPVSADFLTEGNETINLALSNPTGGATLATTQTTATLVLADAPPPLGSPVAPSLADVTAQVGVSITRLRSSGRRVRRRLMLTNNGGASIATMLSVLLSNLPRGVRLRNATGLSQQLSPGNPFVSVPLAGSLAPGASVTLDLEFSTGLIGNVRFDARVLAGTGVI